MNRIVRTLALIVLGVAATACAEAPFVTSPPGERPPKRAAAVVAVCYHADATTREEIYAVAATECERLSITREKPFEFDGLELWRSDTVFNGCPIFAKARVSFLCLPQ